MVTRALVLGKVDIRRLLLRECLVGGLVSLVLGTVCFIRVVAEYPTNADSAAVVSITLAAIAFLATFLGAGFSLLLDRFNLDPAAGSAPLLTTVADLCGISLLAGITYSALGS
jgi:magnesium transporter